MWDIVHWPGPLHCKLGVLATGPPRKPQSFQVLSLVFTHPFFPCLGSFPLLGLSPWWEMEGKFVRLRCDVEKLTALQPWTPFVISLSEQTSCLSPSVSGTKTQMWMPRSVQGPGCLFKPKCHVFHPRLPFLPEGTFPGMWPLFRWPAASQWSPFGAQMLPSLALHSSWSFHLECSSRVSSD